MENACNTIFSRSFLAELCKNPDLHRIIPLVDMMYSRDSTMYYFDPNDASLLFGTFQSRTGVRQGDSLVGLLVKSYLLTQTIFSAFANVSGRADWETWKISNC
jgi:hypothetical protein